MLCQGPAGQEFVVLLCGDVLAVKDSVSLLVYRERGLMQLCRLHCACGSCRGVLWLSNGSNILFSLRCCSVSSALVGGLLVLAPSWLVFLSTSFACQNFAWWRDCTSGRVTCFCLPRRFTHPQQQTNWNPLADWFSQSVITGTPRIRCC